MSSAAQPASSWLETALVPSRPPAPILENLVPIFEIVHADGMLWSLPQELSKEIYDNTYRAQQTRFTRYFVRTACLFDVETMEYINIDDDHQGSLRLAWVNPGELTPSFTGQIPGARRKTKEKHNDASDAYLGILMPLKHCRVEQPACSSALPVLNNLALLSVSSMQ